MDEFTVRRLTAVTSETVEAFARLVPQLSERAAPPCMERLLAVMSDSRTRLYVAESAEGIIVGTLTMVLYDIPTGRRAWIEDVVVDEAWRGRGCAGILVRRAIREAAAEGAGTLMLTSNPRRRAAHALYGKMGFERYDTSVFRMKLR